MCLDYHSFLCFDYLFNFFFSLALKEIVSNIHVRKCASYVKMSSEISSKRKSEDSVEVEDSSTKKPKVSDEVVYLNNFFNLVLFC